MDDDEREAIDRTFVGQLDRLHEAWMVFARALAPFALVVLLPLWLLLALAVLLAAVFGWRLP